MFDNHLIGLGGGGGGGDTTQQASDSSMCQVDVAGVNILYPLHISTIQKRE